MHLTKIRIGIAIAFLVLTFGMGSAHAQDLLNQDWVLNANQSNIYIQTEKLQGVIEKHRFTSIEGNVSRNGDASIKIDLNSIDTGIDLRNVRMRFLLFETYKFPTAEITAKLDKSQLTELATRSRVSFTLTAHVNLHGIVKDIQIPVTVSRVNDTTVTVSSIKPIDVAGETFDFMKGLGKLSDAMNGIRIVPSASITFDLSFGTGSAMPALEAARVEREKTKAQEAAATISSEGCETRFTVLSESNSIYFKSGSAELDRESEPLLETGADIANRCPSVTFDVEGHTDNVGGRRFNQRLSERRARAVVDYLKTKGIIASRIESAGYGETRPVAPNDSETGRAKNRRIEFKVKKD